MRSGSLVSVRMSPEHVERLRRSIAMLSPRDRATALSREDAIAIIEELQEMQRWVRQLISEAQRLLND